MTEEQWDKYFFEAIERRYNLRPAREILGLTESELSSMRDMEPEKAAASFKINLVFGDE